MAHLAVGTEPVQVPVSADQIPLIVNASAGGQKIYWSRTATNCSVAKGIPMDEGHPIDEAPMTGSSYEFPRKLVNGGGELWVVADAEGGDLRYEVIG